MSTARRHDIRLVLPAAATWMAAAVVAAWPVGRGVTTVAVTGGLLAAAAVARRFALVAVATGLLLGAAAATTHVWLVHSGPVARLASRHGHAELTMRLVRDPLTRASGRGVRFTIVDATVTAIDGQSSNSPALILAHGSAWNALLPGQRVRVRARLTPPHAGDSISAVVVPAARPVLP